MASENTVLVKFLAVGLFVGGALAQFGASPLTAFLRRAFPAHFLLVLALVSAVWSPSPSFAWPAAVFAVTLWLATALCSAPAIVHWRAIIPAAAAVPLALGFGQLIGLDPTPWQELARAHFHGRACSTLGNPNFFAAFLAGTIPFLAALSLSASSRPGKALSFAGLLLSGAGLTGSGSKGGMAGLLAGMAVFGVAWLMRGPGRREPRLRLLYPALTLASGILLGIILMPAGIRGRLVMADPGAPAQETGGTIDRLVRDESLRFRLLTWGQTLRMVRETPILGHGLGRFQVVYPRFRLPEIISMFGQHSYMTDHPENISLEIAADLGAIGLGGWIWLLVYIGACLTRRLSRGPPLERILAAACGGGLAGLLAANSFGLDIHYGGSAALAACLAGASFSRPGGTAVASRLRLHPVGAALGLLLCLAWARFFASDAALARALDLSNRGLWTEALPHYRKADTLNPANVMSRYFHASALLDRGQARDLPQARALLEGVRKESPDYVLVNYKLWLLYNRLGLKAQARDALARQMELDPTAAEFYLERGRAEAEEGRLEQARSDFEKAVSLDPENPTGYQYLGNLMVMRGLYREAIGVYAAGIARNPRSAELHYNSAVAAYRSGKADLARRHALAALEISPDHVRARAVLEKLGK